MGRYSRVNNMHQVIFLRLRKSRRHDHHFHALHGAAWCDAECYVTDFPIHLVPSQFDSTSIANHVEFPITCRAIRLLEAHQDAMFATVPRLYMQLGQKPTKDNVVLLG